MKRLVFTSLCVVIGLNGSFLFAQPTNDHPSLSVQDRIRDIFDTSSNCVVRVKAIRKDSKEEKTNRVLKMGSGFFCE